MLQVLNCLGELGGGGGLDRLKVGVSVQRSKVLHIQDVKSVVQRGAPGWRRGRRVLCTMLVLAGYSAVLRWSRTHRSLHFTPTDR